jgi:hypothetical protein
LEELKMKGGLAPERRLGWVTGFEPVTSGATVESDDVDGLGSVVLFRKTRRIVGPLRVASGRLVRKVSSFFQARAASAIIRTERTGLCYHRSWSMAGMKTVQMEVPEQLYAQLRSLVALGWFQDEGDVLREALRRFLEVHRPEIMDEFVRKDVEWGLRGPD